MWVFYRKASNREYVWIKPAAQPASVQVAKQNCFSQKVMLCVWGYFEGIINHFELVQNGIANVAYFNEQLDRVYTALATRYHVALINGKHAFLQNGNSPAVHIAALIKAKIGELPGIEFLPPSSSI